VIDQQRRVDYMEALYRESGRTNGLYTGLFKERLDHLLAVDMHKTLNPECFAESFFS